MQKLLFALVLAIALPSTESRGNERGTFTWMSFNEGIAEAKKTGRKVMIDVYTDWCGWCKKMDKDTYDNGAVADYIGQRYVAIKINAESSKAVQYQGRSYTERELAAAFGINGYPSILFLNHDGDPITVYPGYANASKFSVVLRYIAEEHYKTTKFQDFAGSQQ